MIRKIKKYIIIVVTAIVLAVCGIVIFKYYNSYERTAYSKEISSLKIYNGVNSSKAVKYNNESIPVLMYHSISNENDNNLMKVPKDQFSSQMKYLKDNGYYTLSANEFYNFIVNDVPVPKKSVLITFDDGYQNQYDNAYPILKKYKFHATMFIITNYLDKGTLYLKSNELKEMSDNGIDIESHTLNHAKLDKLSYSDQLANLKDSKDKLENICGKAVRFIAYPYGYFNINTVKACQKADYLMGFTTSGKWANTEKGVYAVNRIYVFPYYSMDNFKDRVNNSNYGQAIHPIDMVRDAYYTFIK